MRRIATRRLATWTAERMERAASATSGGSRVTHDPVGVVLLAWDPTAARRAARELFSHLKLVAPAAQFVLVDNRGSGMDWAGEEGFELVSGDNSAREFSGLQEGVGHVIARCIPACWILANDRYLTNRDVLLPLVDGGTLDAVVATGAVSGRLNGYPTPSRAFGLTIDSWACSNFLVVAGRSLARLGSLVTVGTAELLSVVNPALAGASLLQTDGPLDAAHRHYLTEWLTGEGDSLADHWYRHQSATAGSWNDLCGKTQSILNEQLLSARARQARIPVLTLVAAHSLGRLEPASLSFRFLAASIKAWPGRSPRLLEGLIGRNLVAIHRLRPWRGHAAGAVANLLADQESDGEQSQRVAAPSHARNGV